ncbi:MAG TPA: MBL fold metallo-hydrolase [Mycobacteriales bacterium]|nr:MBL fold metallo-hydrolase [Mycobacteriales bacterium]
MTAVPLADGVWRIPTAPADTVNSLLLADDDGSLVLVDAGLRGAHRAVLRAIADVGKQPGDVQRILLTHGHSDHAGGLARTQRATGAQVLAHEDEAQYVREGTPPPAGTTTGRLLARLPGTGFARTDVDGTFADGAVLPVAGGLQVVHTPGHSPGHCSFLHLRSGVLLTGDAVFNVRGLRYSPKTFCTDVPLSRETASRLGELSFDVVAFTHGAHIATGAQAALRAFLAGRPS